MATESIIEKVLKESTIMVGKVIDHLDTEFRNVRPVLKQPSADEQIWAVDNLGTDDFKDIINEFGEGAVEKLLYKTHQLKTDGRRKINA